jgi:hypothetical protein
MLAIVLHQYNYARQRHAQHLHSSTVRPVFTVQQLRRGKHATYTFSCHVTFPTATVYNVYHKADLSVGSLGTEEWSMDDGASLAGGGSISSYSQYPSAATVGPTGGAVDSSSSCYVRQAAAGGRSLGYRSLSGSSLATCAVSSDMTHNSSLPYIGGHHNGTQVSTCCYDVIVY